MIGIEDVLPAEEKAEGVAVESATVLEHQSVQEREAAQGSEVISEPETASQHAADLP